MAGCPHRGRPRRLELADLVRRFGQHFRDTHRLSGEQLAALRAIERCRTPALGGHLEVCARCGHRRPVYRSCRNRHCPKCQTLDKERWIEARSTELLPVDYFHVVFTLPHALHPVARRYPRLAYDLLFKCAAETLLTLARDPDHLGAEPGILAVLHTWGQNLALHVHLHCIISAGGLDPTHRRWVKRPGVFLFPVRVLSRLFRGKYVEALLRALGSLTDGPGPETLRSLRAQLHHHDWVVYAKKPFAGPARLLDYLARYTHRVALTNDRLLGLEGGMVRLRWRDYAHGGKKKLLRLPAELLLARFLLHVLPRGFQHVRHYGLLANRHKAAKLAACRGYFGLEAPPSPSPASEVTQRLLIRMGIEPERCERCGARAMVCVETLPPQATVVPHARAPTRP